MPENGKEFKFLRSPPSRETEKSYCLILDLLLSSEKEMAPTPVLSVELCVDRGAWYKIACGSLLVLIYRSFYLVI